MNFVKIQTADLRRAITFVKNGVAKKGVLPILSYIRFYSENGNLFLESTDLTVFYRYKVGSCDEDVNTMLPAQEFSGFISKIKDEEINISVDNEKMETLIKAGKTKLKLKTFLPADFPKEQNDLELLEEVDTRAFFNALKNTVFYSGDVTKSILCSINLKCENNKAVFASTDGYRLIVNSAEQGFAETKTINLPGEMSTKIASLLLKEESEKTIILINESKIAFQSDDFYVSTRLMEGKFPDYTKILPKSFTHEFTVDRIELLSVLKQSEDIVDKTSNIIHLEFNSSGLTVFAQNNSGLIESEIEFKGFKEDFNVSFNEAYLIKALNQIESESVIMKCNTAITPVVFYDEIESEQSVVMLMPIRS